MDAIVPTPDRVHRANSAAGNQPDIRFVGDRGGALPHPAPDGTAGGAARLRDVRQEPGRGQHDLPRRILSEQEPPVRLHRTRTDWVRPMTTLSLSSYSALAGCRSRPKI